jgi:hypothetical protein
VIGLIASFTHLFTRDQIFQVLELSITSRGAVDELAHSAGCSVQNSTQPIGARVFSPTDTNIGCSVPALAGKAPSEMFKVAAKNAPAIVLLSRNDIRDPLPSSPGHNIR